jgi:hypothetical protein
MAGPITNPMLIMSSPIVMLFPIILISQHAMTVISM